MGECTCHVKGCDRLIQAKGLCSMHYARKRRYGGTGPAHEIGRWAPLETRFHNHIQIHGPIPRACPHLGVCYIWMGVVNKNGYGTLGHGNTKIYAHRLAWKLAYGGEVPRRLTHLCRNRRCVRPDHLRAA